MTTPCPLTAREGRYLLTCCLPAGHDGLTVMAHTPTGTAEIPYEGKVCRDLKVAKALAEAMDKEREAGVGGT